MELIRQVLAVSAVLLLLAASLWWLRRKGLARHFSGGSRKHALQAVERLMLGPQHSLHLVRLAGRGLLVGTSPAGCAGLERFEWASLESRLPAGDPEARWCPAGRRGPGDWRFFFNWPPGRLPPLRRPGSLPARRVR